MKPAQGRAPSAIPVAVLGARGRMGSVLVRLILADGGLRLCAALTERGDAARGTDAGRAAGAAHAGVAVSDRVEDVVAAAPRVAIDFTAPRATGRNAAALAGAGIACVIGTTGLSDPERARLRALSALVPIVLSPNMSVGASALFSLVRRAAEILGEGYDCEIVETHHAAKRDAPSGTALRLAEVVSSARERRAADVVRHGRAGADARRRSAEIGLHAVRLGDVVGEHRVLFGAAGEVVELRHQAFSREAFAAGALRAARFAAAARPGLYGMDEVLRADGGAR